MYHWGTGGNRKNLPTVTSTREVHYNSLMALQWQVQATASETLLYKHKILSCRLYFHGLTDRPILLGTEPCSFDLAELQMRYVTYRTQRASQGPPQTENAIQQ
jgi:hypothetical protein